MCRAILACTLVVIVNLNPFLTALPACLACTLYSWQAARGGGGGGQGCEHKASVCTSFALTRWGACQLASWGWGAGCQLEGLAWFCSFLSSCFCSLCLTPTCPCLAFQRLLRTRLEAPSRDTQDALCREAHLSCITLRHIHNS